MIGAIPNPQKTIQVEKPLGYMNLAIAHIALFTSDYKLFKAKTTLNFYTFETSEFLSLGVYIDINCSSTTESRTDVTIEIRRKVGTFNQSHEVSNANSHISKIIDLIAESVETDEKERIMRIEKFEIEESERLSAKQEIEQKELQERENNPLLFHGKDAVKNLITVGLIVAGVYIIFKVIFG